MRSCAPSLSRRPRPAPRTASPNLRRRRFQCEGYAKVRQPVPSNVVLGRLAGSGSAGTDRTYLLSAVGRRPKVDTLVRGTSEHLVMASVRACGSVAYAGVDDPRLVCRQCPPHFECG